MTAPNVTIYGHYHAVKKWAFAYIWVIGKYACYDRIGLNI